MMNPYLVIWQKLYPTKVENPNYIDSLAPKIITDESALKKIKPYLDLLKKTINADGITNIALTGGYGSGKSTIIKTFQYLNPEYKYLNISLASFNNIIEVVDKFEDSNESKKTSKKEKKEELERLLEVSILQQIFYHVKPAVIPDSRFKRIKNVSSDEIQVTAACLIFWILSILMLFKFNYINKINPSNWTWIWQGYESLDWLALIALSIFFSGIAYFSKKIIRLFANSKINKLNIKGELELGDNVDKSVFNQHLEEILYFFERTEFNVVLIEDVDRFDSTEIFTKLREINILINNSNTISRDINFIYALRDEMFTDKNERVKFFEYIIPVIPFINPSNAGEQMTRLIENANLKDVLSKDFTEDVVTFIDDIDMRLLINIFHEYQLYKQNLSSDLEQDNLFAIITYKNLFPDDFGKLHKRNGLLHKFLNDKNIYIQSFIEGIENKIIDKRTQIENLEKENINDLHELRAIYINALHAKIPNATSLNLKGNNILFSDLMNEENFELLSEEDHINYYFYQPNFSYGRNFFNSNDTTSNVSFSELEQFVNSDFTYNQRKNFITEKSKNKIDNLKLEIEKLSSEKIEIKSWSLKKIFTEIDINTYLDASINNDLIRSLLINGYINENYSDYISLFHAVNLTAEDFSFERKLKSGGYLSFEHKLVKIENLLKRITEDNFKRDNILNFDLLDYLGKDYSNYSKQYNLIIKNLSNEKNRSIEFIDTYLHNRQEFQNVFINRLFNMWSGLWDFINLKSGYTNEKVKFYFELILKYAEVEDMILHKSNSLSTYIMQRNDFLSFIKDTEYREKIKSVINALAIEFESLTPPDEETQDLYDFVYENDHYQINIFNVNLILKEMSENFSQEEFNHSNYFAIKNSECDSLINYIDNNITTYAKNVYLKIQEENDEIEEYLIELLNHPGLQDSLEHHIIKKTNTIINDLSTIEYLYIQVILLKENKIEANWNNVFVYYDALETKQFDDVLIHFLNVEDNYYSLSSYKLNENNQRPNNFIQEFSLKIINCNDLTLSSYTELLTSIPKNRWTDLKLDDLNEDKVRALIEQDFITFKNSDFKNIKEHFSNHHIPFIEKNQNDFISKYEEFNIDEDDINQLLESVNFTEDNKISLIEKLDDQILIDNDLIAENVCHILANSTKHIQLDFKVLESMFNYSDSIEDRIKILNRNIRALSNTEIQELIELLEGDYPIIFWKRNQPKFEDNKYHRELFEFLKNKKLIIKYDIDKKDLSRLKVYANY